MGNYRLPSKIGSFDVLRDAGFRTSLDLTADMIFPSDPTSLDLGADLVGDSGLDAFIEENLSDPVSLQLILEGQGGVQESVFDGQSPAGSKDREKTGKPERILLAGATGYNVVDGFPSAPALTYFLRRRSSPRSVNALIGDVITCGPGETPTITAYVSLSDAAASYGEGGDESATARAFLDMRADFLKAALSTRSFATINILYAFLNFARVNDGARRAIENFDQATVDRVRACIERDQAPEAEDAMEIMAFLNNPFAKAYLASRQRGSKEGVLEPLPSREGALEKWVLARAEIPYGEGSAYASCAVEAVAGNNEKGSIDFLEASIEDFFGQAKGSVDLLLVFLYYARVSLEARRLVKDIPAETVQMLLEKAESGDPAMAEAFDLLAKLDNGEARTFAGWPRSPREGWENPLLVLKKAGDDVSQGMAKLPSFSSKPAHLPTAPVPRRVAAIPAHLDAAEEPADLYRRLRSGDPTSIVEIATVIEREGDHRAIDALLGQIYAQNHPSFTRDLRRAVARLKVDKLAEMAVDSPEAALDLVALSTQGCLDATTSLSTLDISEHIGNARRGDEKSVKLLGTLKSRGRTDVPEELLPSPVQPAKEVDSLDSLGMELASLTGLEDPRYNHHGGQLYYNLYHYLREGGESPSYLADASVYHLADAISGAGASLHDADGIRNELWYIFVEAALYPYSVLHLRQLGEEFYMDLVREIQFQPEHKERAMLCLRIAAKLGIEPAQKILDIVERRVVPDERMRKFLTLGVSPGRQMTFADSTPVPEPDTKPPTVTAPQQQASSPKDPPKAQSRIDAQLSQYEQVLAKALKGDRAAFDKIVVLIPTLVQLAKTGISSRDLRPLVLLVRLAEEGRSGAAKKVLKENFHGGDVAAIKAIGDHSSNVVLEGLRKAKNPHVD